MKQHRCFDSLLRRLALRLLVAIAMGASLPAAAAVLRLDAQSPVHDTAGYLERLDDREGTLDAAQADAAQAWAAMQGNLNAGFTPATIWLRLTLDVEEPLPEGWMLRLGNALLDDARAYQRRPDGSWKLLGHSGEDVDREDWPVDFRSPTFFFTPDTAGQQVVLLRLQSKNAMMSRLEVWQRSAFDNRSRREGLLFGLYAGFYLLLIGLHAIFWLGTRAPMSGLFLAYIGSCVFNEVFSAGLVQQLSGLSVAWSDRLLGVGMAAALPIAQAVALRQLELARCYPRLAKWMNRVCLGIAAVCAALILSGHYGMGMQPVQMTALALIPILSGLGAYLLWRGWRPARYFLPVFGVFYVGVVIGFLRNLRVLPVNAFTEHATLLGTMVHMLLLSFIVIGRHERQRRARELRQANLAADLARQHSERLAVEVAERTADLSGEIRRRERVEDELRQALEAERQIMAEQRDFVAMVSHEFRTPLAIIGTSAQQLNRNLQSAPLERNQIRCDNIRDASLRLLALVDEYLTEDRVRELRSEPQEDSCDLRAMLADLEQAFPPGRIHCEIDPGVQPMRSDAGLLRIALRNLLANADRHSSTDDEIRVAVREQEGAVRIEVSNAGARIPEPERERLFQKYYRGQNARLRPGAGLGLYLVRQIAARLDGSVDLTRMGGDEPVTFRLSLSYRPVF
ncbi:histidine kinase [Achromobacter denitrificans]|uniref:sensor histidine kinase n=1 Tax=Achromobacter denitrificans TaxID=32002 RepID=UPI000B4CEA07|nr:sensor histidine kinase [Achromobacter denitrificans]ASC68522.1 histidine kinase [Achromobacter denitrificans]